MLQLRRFDLKEKMGDFYVAKVEKLEFCHDNFGCQRDASDMLPIALLLFTIFNFDKYVFNSHERPFRGCGFNFKRRALARYNEYCVLF